MELRIDSFLRKLNEKIKKEKGKDFTIGHAYFIKLKEIPEDQRANEFVKILKNSVFPLLQEYFYDEWEILISLLGNENKRNETCIEKLIIDRFGEIKINLENKNKIVKLLIAFTQGTEFDEECNN